MKNYNGYNRPAERRNSERLAELNNLFETLRKLENTNKMATKVIQAYKEEIIELQKTMVKLSNVL